MYASIYILIVTALSFIAAFPYKANAGEILFAASYPYEPTTDDSPGFIIKCRGPWTRFAGPSEIPIGALGLIFYAAKETIFSPYGEWRCWTCSLLEPRCGVVPSQPTRPPAIARTTFNLRKGLGPVRLTITTDSLVCTSPACGPASGQTLTVKAALGDDNNRLNRERDTWSFQGTGGDTVLVTIEEDPESGHSGEEATLILRDEASNGSSTIEINTAGLPIEITAT